MTTQHFKTQTAYVAAIDWPTLLPESLARSAIEKEGWQVVQVDDCDEPNAVPYELPPGCGDTYDTIGTALRTGPDYTRDLPEEFVWVGEVGADGQPAPPRPPPPGAQPCSCPPTSEARAWWTGVLVGSAGTLGLVGLGAVVAWVVR